MDRPKFPPDIFTRLFKDRKLPHHPFSTRRKPVEPTPELSTLFKGFDIVHTAYPDYGLQSTKELTDELEKVAKEGKPIAFLLIGPAGVGKTHFAIDLVTWGLQTLPKILGRESKIALITNESATNNVGKNIIVGEHGTHSEEDYARITHITTKGFELAHGFKFDLIITEASALTGIVVFDEMLGKSRRIGKDRGVDMSQLAANLSLRDGRELFGAVIGTNFETLLRRIEVRGAIANGVEPKALLKDLNVTAENTENLTGANQIGSLKVLQEIIYTVFNLVYSKAVQDPKGRDLLKLPILEDPRVALALLLSVVAPAIMDQVYGIASKRAIILKTGNDPIELDYNLMKKYDGFLQFPQWAIDHILETMPK